MRKGVAAIIKNKNGDYLLHLRDNKASWMKNEWCLIGGSCEINENPQSTMVREITEEIGISCQEIKLFKKINPKPDLEVFVFVTTIDSVEKIRLTEGKQVKLFSNIELNNLFRSINYSNSYLDILKEYVILNSGKVFTFPNSSVT